MTTSSRLQILSLSFFSYLALVLVFCPEFSDPREFYASHSVGWILVYAYDIW